MKNVSRIQLLSYVLFALSAVILAFAIYMNLNISVLQNWKLTLSQKEAHIGDTLIVQSTYKKLMNVSGKSTRYLECKNSNNIFIRYPVSEAIANRASGVGGTAVIIVIPSTISNVPTTCKVSIVVVYQVFFLRQVVEAASTDEFKLVKQETTSSSSNSSQSGENIQSETGFQNQHQYGNTFPVASQQQQSQQSQQSQQNISSSEQAQQQTTAIEPDSKPLNGNPITQTVNPLIDILLNK